MCLTDIAAMTCWELRVDSAPDAAAADELDEEEDDLEPTEPPG
jgi:hypothetical protein